MFWCVSNKFQEVSSISPPSAPPTPDFGTEEDPVDEEVDDYDEPEDDYDYDPENTALPVSASAI